MKCVDQKRREAEVRQVAYNGEVENHFVVLQKRHQNETAEQIIETRMDLSPFQRERLLVIYGEVNS